MRTLNKLEQVVDYIVEYSQAEEGLTNNIIGILERILSKKERIMKFNLKQEKIWIEKKYKTSESDSTNSIIENVVPIAQVISFVEYLEKMNFIYFVEYFYGAELDDTSQIDCSNSNVYQEVKDSKIKKFIFDNIRSGIFATDDLTDYQRNGYKTVTQRWHEEQIRKMKIQIGWAIAAAFIAAVGTLYPLIKCLFSLKCG